MKSGMKAEMKREWSPFSSIAALSAVCLCSAQCVRQASCADLLSREGRPLSRHRLFNRTFQHCNPKDSLSRKTNKVHSQV